MFKAFLYFTENDIMKKYGLIIFMKKFSNNKTQTNTW